MLFSILALCLVEEICTKRGFVSWISLCGYISIVCISIGGYFVLHEIPAGHLEPILACLCLGIHAWIRPQNHRVRQFILLWMFIVYHDLSASMLQSHILSSAHIYTSWIARVVMLMAVLDIFFYNKTKAVTLSLVLQGASILLGMLWAFDAPGWDAIWHWDYIEICALFTWISLWALSHKHDAFWGYIVLLIQIIQSLVLYAHVGMSDISSHQYVSSAQLEWIIGHVLWFVGVVLGLRTRSTLTSSENPVGIIIAYRTTGIVMLGLLLLGGFVIPITRWSTFLAVFTIIVWTTLVWMDIQINRIRKCLLSFAGLITVIPINFLDVQFDASWARTDEGENILYGINVLEKSEECINYLFTIKIDTEFYDMPYKSCRNEIHPSQYKYIYHKHHLKRLQIIEYTAHKGVLMRTSDVTPQMAYMAFIILLWICGMISMLRKKTFMVRTQGFANLPPGMYTSLLIP